MILLDTNVLVYSVNKAAPQHADCRAVLRLCASSRVGGVLVPQVLLEFYAIVTSSRRVTTPLSAAQAISAIAGFRRRLTVKPVPGDSLAQLLNALSTQPVVGQSVFDLFLVAQMISLGIGDICTHNVNDFIFPGIRALLPAQLLALYKL